MKPVVGVSIVIAWLSMTFTAGFLNVSSSLFLTGAILSALLGILTYVKIILQASPKIWDSINDNNRVKRRASWIERRILDGYDDDNSKETPWNAPVFSRNIDKEINDFFEKAVDEHLLSTLESVLHLDNDTDDDNSIDQVSSFLL